ncbi:TldD/PmbA family protein [Candidatus Pelagibacter sp. HIMB109]|uniref:TldD/PmbA family protein n=1 Tax=Candidatus Pelagibacter sp. HIMB109 TaxID=3415412 RepID=UPI003F853B4F
MLKTKDFLSDLATKCISKSKNLGATDVEVGLSNNISETLNFRNGKIEHFDRSETLSLGLTTYINKKKSNVSTSNLDQNNLILLIEKCIECTKISPEDKYVGLPDKKELENNKQDLDLYDDKELSNDFKQDYLKEIENEMFSFPKIKNSNGSSFSENKSNFIFANSNGFCDGYYTSSFSIFCEALAEEDGEMERDYEMSISRFYKDLENAKTIGKIAAEKACKRLGAKKIESGKMPVIFDKRVSKSLLSTFASAISGSSFVRGTSFLKEYLGKDIFSKEVNIIDDPLIERGLGSQAFDAEGVKNKKINVVKNGRFNELLLDTYNSKILNMTSNGRCGGTTNFYLENGNEDLKKIISEQKKAFFVTELIGRAGDITNGNYSVGASGIMIENGEFAYPVNEVTIASNLKYMFKNLIPCNDLDFKTSTNSPSIIIDGLTIAGK